MVDQFGRLVYSKIVISRLKTLSQHLLEVTVEDHKHQTGKMLLYSRIETGSLGDWNQDMLPFEQRERGKLSPAFFSHGTCYFFLSSE